MIDEDCLRLRIFDGELSWNVQWPVAGPTCPQLFVIDGGPVDLHGVALQVQLGVLDNVVSDHGSKEVPQVFSVARRSGVVVEKPRPEEIAPKVVLQSTAGLDFFPDGPPNEFEKIVLFSSLLGVTEETHHEVLNPLALLFSSPLLAQTLE